MQVRAEKIFPILIPRLIASPITAFNARALAALVRVAGAALGRRLTNIVDALQSALKSEKDDDTRDEIDEALNAVLAAVEDHESGLGSLLMHMLSLSKHESPEKRVTGCTLFMRFCQVTEADFSELVRSLHLAGLPFADDLAWAATPPTGSANLSPCSMTEHRRLSVRPGWPSTLSSRPSRKRTWKE